MVNATTYYVATTGSDTNPGTITQPFRNWEKLSSVMVTGDVGLIRGGTYVTQKTGNQSVYCNFHDLHGTSGSLIIIQNYPGEYPVLDLTSVGNPINTDPVGMYLLNCSYLRIKGLRITGLKQNTGGTGISSGLQIWSSPNCIVDFCETDHIGGSGMLLEDASNNVTFLNCDSHDNGDGLSTNSEPWGGADGFDRTGNVSSTNTVYDHCRAWRNSDDGFDSYATNGTITYIGCQAFWNGYRPDSWVHGANGEGFKLGPLHTQIDAVTKTLTNCIAFGNYDTGFEQNGKPTTLYVLYNCDAYANGGDGFNFQYSNPFAIQTLKNNVSYGNTKINFRYVGSTAQITNNTWNGLVTVTNADFVSLDTTGMSGPRGSDGSLPITSFLRLATGSDLINAGVNVGLPFNPPAPDMGAFEFGSASLPTAYAGPDQNITGTTCTLTGSGTGTSITYGWQALDGGTITTPSSATTSVTGLVPKAYRFVLTVTDTSMNVARDTVVITVNSTTTPVVTPTKYIQASANILSRSIATVTWKVNSVSNSKGFDVYRTYNGVYIRVASIKANGVSYSQKYNVQKGTTKFKIWSNEIVGLPVTVEVSVKKN